MNVFDFSLSVMRYIHTGVHVKLGNMTPEHTASPLVWINGFPGVGKLTIAKEIAKLYADNRVVLIDNHQLIDPVAARIERDDPAYYVERQKERQKAFDRWVLDKAESQRTIVFTDCQADNEIGRSVANEYKIAAQAAGREFVPILLHCDHAENLERAVSLERQSSGTTKLTDTDALEKLRLEHEMLTFGTPTERIIDVTTETPKRVAMELFNHIRSMDKAEGTD